jgi:predicted ATP-grasp superfamily ATP-dependent carboligase
MTFADTTTPAVVLKFDQNVMHHGGLGAIRSLGRLGVPVYGVHEGPWAPAASSRYLRGRWFWQPDAEQAERTTSGLLTLAERIGRPAVLIPTDDAGAIFLAEHGAALREAFLFPAPPAGLPRRVAGKFSMHEVCREHGMPAPLTALPGSADEAAEFAARVGYPLIAKLPDPWSAASAGLRSTSVLATGAELASLWAACERAGAGLMLQEFIPAGPGDDWFFHGYSGAGQACRPAFTGVKVRSYPAHAGLTSLGYAAPNAPLRAQVTALLESVSYRGIVDLDLRRDSRDGEYKLLDFNPRLGAQFRLFRDSADVDVVLAAYLDLTGQDIPAGSQLSGRRFLVENYDPIAALGYWRSGELGPRRWLASLRGVDEAAWFARDDLRPFGLMCLRMGARAITRRFAGRGGHRGGEPRYRAGRAAERPAYPEQPQPVLAAARRTTEHQESPARRSSPGPDMKGDPR